MTAHPRTIRRGGDGPVRPPVQQGVRRGVDRAGAAVALVVLLVGLPVALVVLVGWPLPTGIPSLDGLVGGVDGVGGAPGWLTQPLTSAAVVKVLATVAWVLYLHFVLCVAVETINIVRSIRFPTAARVRLPFAGPSQVLAYRLVAAVLLAGATVPSLAPPTAVAELPTTPGAAVATTVDPVLLSGREQLHIPPHQTHGTDQQQTDQQQTDQHTGRHTAGPHTSSWSEPASAVAGAGSAGAPGADLGLGVVAGDQVRRYVVSAPRVGSYDNLWDIAVEHLGDGMRWSQIYDLNVGLAQPDGDVLDDPDLIRPGWQLRMPADAALLPAWSEAQPRFEPQRSQASQDGSHHLGGVPADPSGSLHVVRPGDTLWQVAETTLGDGSRFPEIVAAAAGVVQSDGGVLTDPDLIRPGWVLPVPAPAPAPGPDTGLVTTTTTPAVSTPEQSSAPTPAPIPEPAPEPARVSAPVPAPSLRVLEGLLDEPHGQQGDTAPRSAQPSSVVPENGTESGSGEPIPGTAASEDAGDDRLGEAVDGSTAVVLGTTFGSLLLVGGVFAALLTARRRQYRSRRPGRSLAPTPAGLVGLERELLQGGPTGAVQGEFLDLALRTMAAGMAATGVTPPEVIAAGMGPDRLDLRLRTPRHDAPAPFTADDSGLWWTIPTTTRLDPSLRDTHLAPLPMLVTVGSRGQSRWMVDLEAAGTLTLVGPATRTRALARFIGAELATNVWSDSVAITVTGIASELLGLNPDRIRTGTDPDRDLARHRTHLDRQRHLMDTSGVDALTGRIHDVAGDSWMPQVLIIDPAPHPGTAPDVSSSPVVEIDPDPHAGAGDRRTDGGQDEGDRCRLGAALVVVHAGDDPTRSPETRGTDDGLVVVLDEEGRLRIEDLALTADAEGLSESEAAGIASIVATARDSLDIAMAPMTGQSAWARMLASDGSLLPELTQPRTQDPDDASDPERAPGHGAPDGVDETGALSRPRHIDIDDTNPDQAPEGHEDRQDRDNQHGHEAGESAQQVGAGSSLLPLPDEAYLAVAATTVEDLASLAPRVRPGVRDRLEATDPDLTADLAAWRDPHCDRPRLSLLGAPALRAHGDQPAKTVGPCVELAAFMASRPKVETLDGALQPAGVTSDEVATALRVKQTSARTILSKLRGWLGTNPRTGRQHLPDAIRGQASGAGLYVVEDLLVDVDLLMRLHARGCARGGPDGIQDLRDALSLVGGEPLTQLRAGGWTWATDGDRIDHRCTAAIVNIAHLVVVDALTAGDTTTARQAAQTALTAAPYEETPRLDLVAVREAEGDRAAAELDLRDTVLDRLDDDRDAPDAPSERTQTIIDQRGWLRRTG